MANYKSKTEPDVEDILASIREIIAEDDIEIPPRKKKKAEPAKKPALKAVPVKKAAKPKKAKTKPAAPKKMPDLKEEKPEAEDVLVLTEVAPPEPRKVEPEIGDLPPELAAEVKKEVLEEAREIGIEPSPEIDAAMEDLVRSMLKEMLKDYLDQHMADIVKKVAAEEVLKMKKKS